MEHSHLTGALEDSGRRMDSRFLTAIHKLVLTGGIVAVGVAGVCTDAQQAPRDLHSVVWEIPGGALLVFAAAWCWRLRKVVAHSDQLLISNYLAETHVAYDEIEEIKGYRGRSIVYIRLRLRNPCRFGRTIRFVLPSQLSGIEAQPEFRLLRAKCPRLSERSKNWWLGAVYLRLPATEIERVRETL